MRFFHSFENFKLVNEYGVSCKKAHKFSFASNHRKLIIIIMLPYWHYIHNEEFNQAAPVIYLSSKSKNIAVPY